MEKNYYKLSGFADENLDLGFFKGVRMPKIRTPKIKMPRVKMPKVKIPKVRMPKISTKSFNKSIKGITKSFRGAGKSFNRLSSDISKGASQIGKDLSNIGTDISDVFNQGVNSYTEHMQNSMNVGKDVLDTGLNYLKDVPLQFGQNFLDTTMDVLSNVSSGLFPGSEQNPQAENQMESEDYNESYDIPEESETVYNDPELGDYILDADGNPIFFDENSNALYYGY